MEAGEKGVASERDAGSFDCSHRAKESQESSSCLWLE
jgi:hypothetical protein